jgi:hypothetical protein
MKKKYFAPEMEEVKLDEPLVLDDVVEPSLTPIAPPCDDDLEA